jgi:proteasome lid subunit RPN8/RPN11
MSFSLARTMRHLLAPDHRLSCSSRLWKQLLRDLRARGGGRRESGAFLLGLKAGERRYITHYVLYDDLDPHSLDTGIVTFNGQHYGKLWAICRERQESVVGDVHVHPGLSHQSQSDRDHPMLSVAGHLSLIIPHFARTPVQRREIGIYRYRHDGGWDTINDRDRNRFFHIGW